MGHRIEYIEPCYIKVTLFKFCHRKVRVVVVLIQPRVKSMSINITNGVVLLLVKC